MGSKTINIKQKIIELCDEFIIFWQRLKEEIQSIPDDDNVELVCKWYDYFEEHGDTVDKFSDTKSSVKEVEMDLLMRQEIGYEE